MWFYKKTLILITLNESLVKVQKFNLDLQSNGIMVQLLTSITFELYNCLMIYNYSFQVIDSMCLKKKKKKRNH